MATFLYQLTPCRPTFITDITPEEEAIVGQHFQYLQDLLAKGQLHMAGPCEDGAFGISIFDAESEEGARAIMARDPAIVHGVMTAQLHPFRISLWKGRVQG